MKVYVNKKRSYSVRLLPLIAMSKLILFHAQFLNKFTKLLKLLIIKTTILDGCCMSNYLVYIITDVYTLFTCM